MITSIEPENWKSLQNWVADILSQCGLNAQTEHTITTVRGTVEVDVWAGLVAF